jgi:hypothetical protein
MVSTVKVTNIDTPDNTGNITFDRPIVGDGSGLTGVSGGKVLQVVMTTDNSAVSITNGQEYSALATEITPSATSSKVLVMVTLGLVSTDSASDTGYEIRRDSTDLQQGTGGTENSTYGAFMNEIGSSDAISASGMLLDSPGVDVATTYKILARPNSTHALVINKRSSNSSLRVSSSMILMEIGA